MIVVVKEDGQIIGRLNVNVEQILFTKHDSVNFQTMAGYSFSVDAYGGKTINSVITNLNYKNPELTEVIIEILTSKVLEDSE